MKQPPPSSSRVHPQNIVRELSQLINHIEADAPRVDDPRFRGLLEKSNEVLKGLRRLFERFGPNKPAKRTNEPATPGRPKKTVQRSPAAIGKLEAKEIPMRRSKADDAASQSAKEESRGARAEMRAPTVNRRAEQRPTPSVTPTAANASAKPQDPDAIAAQLKQQRNEARAPKMPGGHAAPKPLPFRSGKPIWSKPHSS